MYLLFGLPHSVFGAFLGTSPITIDGNIASGGDWGTTGSPTSGIVVSQDASNTGTDDGSVSANTAQDLNYFWMGMSTVSGGTTTPTTGNEIQAFYFRVDTLGSSGTMDQKYNIQLNLGVADAGKAGFLLQVEPGNDGVDSPEVIIILLKYDTAKVVGAFTSGAITGKVSNVASPYPQFVNQGGVQDTNATGAIGQYGGTNYGFEIKIPVDWFGSTYGGNVTAVGTGSTTLVTAVFSSTGSLGGVGTAKDPLNNADGTTTGTSTDATTGDTDFVVLEVSKLVITSAAQTLTAGTASSAYTVQTQDGIGPRAVTADTTIALTSDSSTGKFDTSAGGAFDGTITSVTISKDADSTTFFYKDTVSGTPTITAAEDPAASPDWTNATQQQTVNPGTLTSTNVQPESLNNNVVGNVDISFTTVNPIPADGKIVVTLPNTFTISSGSTTAVVSDNFDGNVSVGISGQIITITRSGGSEIAASTAVTLKLSNIKNPSSAGSTGTYSIKTTDSSSTTIDQDTAVSADTIVQDPNQTITDTSSATLSDSFDLGFARTSTATLSDSFTLGFAQTSSATLASTAQSTATFSRTSTATITDTVDLAIPRTSTATLSDSFGLGFQRTSTATLSDTAQSAATFSRTSTATISDPFDLGIPRTSTATLNDSFNLGLPRTSTFTLNDASQSAADFSRTSTATLNDPAQNAASFGRSSTATLGDTFGLGIARTSTSTLSDASQSAAAFFRTSTSTLGDSAQNAADFNPTSTVTLNDSFGLGLAQASTATLGDSFGLGFPRTSTATLGDSFGLGLGQSSTATLGDSFGLGLPRTSTATLSDSFGLGFSRTSTPTLGDTAQNAAGFGRGSTATLSDSFGCLPSGSTSTLNDTAQNATGIGRASTSTLGDSSQSAATFSRTSTATLGDPAQNAASFSRSSTATLSDSFGLGLPRTSTATLGDTAQNDIGSARASTSTLGDASQSTVTFSRASTSTLGDTTQNATGFGKASTATLGDSSDLGYPRTSEPTLSDSFSLGFPLTSASTLGDSFSLGSPRISVSTLGDTAQNATSSGRPSTATISDTFSLTHTVIGTLTDTDVQPQSLLASAVGNVDVSFKLNNILPKDAKIIIILPSAFTISSGAATALVSDNFDGGASVALDVSNRTITITRDDTGTDLSANTSVTLQFSNTQNPIVSGSTGTYAIKTTNSSGTTIDQDLSVGADTITVETTTSSTGEITALTIVRSADLAVVKTGSPSSLIVGNNVTYTLAVTNNGPDNATGSR